MGTIVGEEWAERVNKLTGASIHARAEELRELVSEARLEFETMRRRLNELTVQVGALEREVRALANLLHERLPRTIHLVEPHRAANSG